MKTKFFKLVFVMFCFSSLFILNSCELFNEPDDEIKTEEIDNGGNESVSTQCKGYTQKGSRCKNMTKSSSGYCYLHD